MSWNSDLILLLDREGLVKNVLELLKRIGFKEYEKVSGNGEWGIDIMAIREDPLSGIEKVVILIHQKGLASSRDINVFADLVDRYKADKGIIISAAGFTKDARVLISREYRGKIVPWDGEKLISLFNNYGIEPSDELLQRLKGSREKQEKKDNLKEFELDAPLLYEFSLKDVLKRVSALISSRYPIKPEEVKLEQLSLKLSSAYIFTWNVNEEKDKAVVFSKESLVLKTSTDSKLSVAVKKAMLNDKSKLKATEKKIETKITPSEAVFVLKEALAKELKVSENDVAILDRKKVYIPEEAFLKLIIGENEAKAFVNLQSGDVSFEISPLPPEYFQEKTQKLVMGQTQEGILESNLTRKNGKVKVTGYTERFSFEISFNEYTGKVLSMEVLLSDEALDELLKNFNPRGEILNIEKGRKTAVVDILTEEGIVILEVDLTRGEITEKRKLVLPEKAMEMARKVIEPNFPLKGLRMRAYSVVEHKYLELLLENDEGRAKVKVEGETGDVLDYVVEISEEKAKEITAGKYQGFEIVSVKDEKTHYTVKAVSEEHEIMVKLSKDGKLMEETDRVLRREVAEELAFKRAKEIDPEAKLEHLSLKDNWIAEFEGRTKVGRIILKRDTGEIVEEDIRLTERAIEALYHEHVIKNYNESNPLTERLTHYKEKGYVNIKVAGTETYYYARIDTKTGRIISEDRVQKRGITSKLKQMHLESKYN